MEPNRHWDAAARKLREGEPQLRQAVFAGKLEEAAFIQTKMLIEFFKDTGKSVHPNRYKVFTDLSVRLEK